MAFLVPADNTFERERRPEGAANLNASRPREEVRMSALHQIVPIFLLLQFFVILGGLAMAMLFAAPETLLPSRKTSRRLIAHRRASH